MRTFLSTVAVCLLVCHAIPMNPVVINAAPLMLTPSEENALVDQPLRLGLSPEEIVQALRTSSTALRNAFLPRTMNIKDPLWKVPGFAKNAKLMLSKNKNLANGAWRAQRYAELLDNHPNFTLLRMDEPTTTTLGRTDRDIVYRHLPSGREGRIEVKDVKPESQLRNLDKYKLQIDKMAEENRTTGTLQSLINRKEVIPELRAYAEERGVVVYENVATGNNASKPGMQSFNDVLEDISSREDNEAVQHGLPWRLDSTESRTVVADGLDQISAIGAVEDDQIKPGITEDAVEEELAESGIEGGIEGGSDAAAIEVPFVGEALIAGTFLSEGFNIYRGIQYDKFSQQERVELMQFLTKYYSQPTAKINR